MPKPPVPRSAAKLSAPKPSSPMTAIRPSLVELDAVMAVAGQRNFRRAAAELGMSPSALSHAVAALEQRFGLRLFHRTTRSVALTEAGAQFLERLRPALAAVDAAMETVNNFRARPTGTLRINSSEGAARRLIAPVMLEYLRRYPEMQLELIAEGRMIDIVAEGFDAGIRIAAAVPQDMIAIPCSPPVRFTVVGAPDYFKRHKKPHSPADLLAHRCIRRRMPSGALAPWEFEKRGKALAIDVRGPLTLDSSDLMVEAALAGAGLAWVSEWSVADHLKSRRLIPVLADWTPPEPGLCLYYPGHRHVPASLRAFVDVTKEVMGRRK
ncbi:MAG TPA: LysR family transcriptional regulator [Dongiaceae bacterium]|nr:LysR family transcriptional regulator [Dongiaceae bacterium]